MKKGPRRFSTAALIYIVTQVILNVSATTIDHDAPIQTALSALRQPRRASPVTIAPTPTEVTPTPVEDDLGFMKRLEPAATPILLADRMGLIMPDPFNPVYVGLNYSFGFVDPTPKPAPTVGGWLRQIQPLLILPNYDINIFASTGQVDPKGEGTVPPGSDGLCGVTVINSPVEHPFAFQKTGWYMFVINQTWVQPTITNKTCELPIVAERSFFSWQSLSVASLPTSSPSPFALTRTLYNLVVTSTPGPLPFEKTHESRTYKLAVGLGITGAVLALIGMGAVIYYAQRRAKMKRECLAFSRLSERDKQEFLADNPDSWLNPNRQMRNARGSPPASPGTWAYENWYWQQMWNRQHQSWRWGRHNRATPAGVGGPQMAMFSGYPGYQGMYGYGPQHQMSYQR